MFAGFTALWVDDLSIFPPYSARTVSGTALQERARAISSKDETMRGLIIKLSVENSLESRDEINVVAQKTVTTVKLSPKAAYVWAKSASLVSR